MITVLMFTEATTNYAGSVTIEQHRIVLNPDVPSKRLTPRGGSTSHGTSKHEVLQRDGLGAEIWVPGYSEERALILYRLSRGEFIEKQVSPYRIIDLGQIEIKTIE